MAVAVFGLVLFCVLCTLYLSECDLVCFWIFALCLCLFQVWCWKGVAPIGHQLMGGALKCNERTICFTFKLWLFVFLVKKKIIFFMDTHFSFLFMFCSLISPRPKWGVTLDMNDFFQRYISAILMLFCDPV